MEGHIFFYPQIRPEHSLALVGVGKLRPTMAPLSAEVSNFWHLWATLEEEELSWATH